jgi:4-nitrophenyl phosphatase
LAKARSTLAPPLLARYDTFLLDCDGVLWDATTPIEGAVDAINTLKAEGKQVIFLTNNAAKTRSFYVEKFRELGFGTIDVHSINTSASAAADMCVNCGYSKVFVCGEEGLVAELQAQGIDTVWEKEARGMTRPEFDEIEIDKDVQAVVAGWDGNFAFRKLCLASLYVQEGAQLVITNEDSAVKSPTPGRMMPGNGSTSGAILRSVQGACTFFPAINFSDFTINILSLPVSHRYRWYSSSTYYG